MTVRPAGDMEEDEANPYHQFILFGDSLIQQSTRAFCLTQQLQTEYIRRLDVVNRGFSGYNTRYALPMLDRIMPSPKQAHVRFLLILLGANDSVLKDGPNGIQHVPLDEFKSNLSQMINHPKVKRQNPRIILLTPPPVNEYLLNGGRKAENAQMYAEAVKEVARTEKVAVLDIWTYFMKHVGWEGGQPLPGSKSRPPSEVLRTVLADGLHFTPVASAMVFQQLLALIEREFPDQTPSKLRMPFPAWQILCRGIVAANAQPAQQQEEDEEYAQERVMRHAIDDMNIVT